MPAHIVINPVAITKPIQAVDKDIKRAAREVSTQFDWTLTEEGFDFWQHVFNRLDGADHE
jgi:hypothetical protein